MKTGGLDGVFETVATRLDHLRIANAEIERPVAEFPRLRRQSLRYHRTGYARSMAIGQSVPPAFSQPSAKQRAVREIMGLPEDLRLRRHPGHVREPVPARPRYSWHWFQAFWHRPVPRPESCQRRGFLDAVCRSRRRCAQEPCLELLAVSAVVDPIAGTRDPLTGRNACSMLDEARQHFLG